MASNRRINPASKVLSNDNFETVMQKENPDKVEKRTVVIFYLGWILQFHLKRLMVRLSCLSNQSIKVTEDLAILSVNGNWNKMAGQ